MANGNQSTQKSAFTYQVSARESLSEGVIRAVSAISGTNPVPGMASDSEAGQELEPLYSVIDPEALDSMFKSTDDSTTSAPARVTFSYDRHEVTVRDNGRISVEHRNPPER